MVHKDDAEARTLEHLWRQQPRHKRAEVVLTAQRAEHGLLLQLQETEASIKDARDVSANMPRIRENVQRAHNALEQAEEVMREAVEVMAGSVVAKATLRFAFNDTREAWLQVPTYKRHQLWDAKLKKKVLKVLA